MGHLGMEHADVDGVLNALRNRLQTVSLTEADEPLRLTSAYVFGSLGASEATDTSDIDIVIAVETTEGNRVNADELRAKLMFGREDILYAANLPIRAEPENVDLLVAQTDEGAIELIHDLNDYDMVYDLLAKTQTTV